MLTRQTERERTASRRFLKILKLNLLTLLTVPLFRNYGKLTCEEEKDKSSSSNKIYVPM